MSAPSLNKKVKDTSFELHGESSKLSELRGKWLVLFFYPRDNTPGCTTEATAFRDLSSDFEKLGAQIIGVSRDNERSHDRFTQKFDLNFPLIADTEEELCLHFDVMKEKMMYGKQVRGIERSTFIIDPEGALRHEWRKLKAKGHAEEVLETLQALTKA
mgnify:CR=1 FL=1